MGSPRATRRRSIPANTVGTIIHVPTTANAAPHVIVRWAVGSEDTPDVVTRHTPADDLHTLPDGLARMSPHA